MVAQEFFGQLDKLHFIDSSTLNDFADRCAYLLSFVVLVICFTIVALKSYVFEPLTCYSSVTVSGHNVPAYVNAFCWVNGTVPADVDGARLDTSSYWNYLETKKINYYQWVPLVLALQAIMCYLPSLFWEALTFNRIGSNLNFYIEAAQSAARESGANRKNKVQFLASALDTLFYARRPLDHGYRSRLSSVRDFIREMLPSKRLGRALCAYYLFVKLLYFGNAVAQIIIMENFLGMKGRYKFFGYQILTDLWNGRNWQESLIFPRASFCRAPIKTGGESITIMTAQCVMPINMLNEKIYIFLWFWFIAVATLQAASIVTWIFRICFPKRRVRSLIRYLEVADAYDKGMKESLQRFESSCLRPDGSFLLYMLRLNAGDIITNEILQALFERFIRHEKAVANKKIQESVGVIITNPNQGLEKGPDQDGLKQRFSLLLYPLVSPSLRRIDKQDSNHRIARSQPIRGQCLSGKMSAHAAAALVTIITITETGCAWGTGGTIEDAESFGWWLAVFVPAEGVYAP
ncbi:hypothetical protein Aperf_G00000032242 [Anoplocephala perfoliata]